MDQKPDRDRLGHPYRLPPRWRWLLWPALTVSAGGAAIALSAVDDDFGLTDCLPLLALPALAAAVYWFNRLVFGTIAGALPTRTAQRSLPDRQAGPQAAAGRPAWHTLSVAAPARPIG